MIDYSSNLITSIEQDNPFVTFDTSGNGVSRLDSITWDFTSQKENTKKISFEHILNICNARIDEIIDLIISKNINLKNFDKRNLDLYIYFEDNNLLKNLSHQFKKRINSGLSVETHYNFEANQENTAKIFSELISRGWVKEAIPVTKKKKSLISRIFSLIFE